MVGAQCPNGRLKNTPQGADHYGKFTIRSAVRKKSRLQENPTVAAVSSERLRSARDRLLLTEIECERKGTSLCYGRMAPQCSLVRTALLLAGTPWTTSRARKQKTTILLRSCESTQHRCYSRPLPFVPDDCDTAVSVCSEMGCTSAYANQKPIISSMLGSPQRIAFDGSGFSGLLAELSKWAVVTSFVPFGSMN